MFITLVKVFNINKLLFLSLEDYALTLFHVNPIAYGILRLSQLQGWDFYPTPQKTMLKLFDWFEIWYTYLMA